MRRIVVALLTLALAGCGGASPFEPTRASFVGTWSSHYTTSDNLVVRVTDAGGQLAVTGHVYTRLATLDPFTFSGTVVNGVLTGALLFTQRQPRFANAQLEARLVAKDSMEVTITEDYDNTKGVSQLRRD